MVITLVLLWALYFWIDPYTILVHAPTILVHTLTIWIYPLYHPRARSYHMDIPLYHPRAHTYHMDIPLYHPRAHSYHPRAHSYHMENRACFLNKHMREAQ